MLELRQKIEYGATSFSRLSRFSWRVIPGKMRHILSLVIALLLFAGCSSQGSQSLVWDLKDVSSWLEHTSKTSSVEIRADDRNGGNFDVLGEGSLLLQKVDSTGNFWRSSKFKTEGIWRSKPIVTNGKSTLSISAKVKNYGQPQNMDEGWTKFTGNPLIAPKNWHLASDQSLQLPDSLEANDQSLVRGTGPYKGKWLLVFNVGGWAVGGWALAVADSLAPLKRGINPFELVEPYPIYGGAGGEHAPNDWLFVNDTWYAPDESRDHISRMWTTTDFTDWAKNDSIAGMKGHDPGMAWDGKRFYLFSEDGNKLQFATAKDPLGQWTAHGVALDVGDHTGDADLCYFNNTWHMFFDDGLHLDYSLGYAQTSPEQFPEGWQLENDVFGPKNPDQGQQWDEPGQSGNNFGTGDADIAVEGQTLYMTYERTVGIAYKELELDNLSEQTIQARLLIDKDGDRAIDQTGSWKSYVPGEKLSLSIPESKRVEVSLELKLVTKNQRESPMISRLAVRLH